MSSNNIGIRRLSKIPMFNSPELYGGSIYESTYANDYQRKSNLNNQSSNYDDNHDQLYINRNISKSLDYFPRVVDFNSQPLYKTGKYGLEAIHRPRRISGINQFRSPMDPSIRKETQNNFNSQSMYNQEFSSFSKPKIPSYIRKDGYYHTNSEKNVRYLKSYNGALIPYIPSFPTLKKPLPPIGTQETNHEKDFPHYKTLFYTSN